MFRKRQHAAIRIEWRPARSVFTAIISTSDIHCKFLRYKHFLPPFLSPSQA